MLLTARITVLTALALSACVPSIVVGDKGLNDDDTTTTTDPSTGASTTEDPPPPSTGEPTPGVCGDGVVDPGEACDDGNDAPDDGCDAACARTGEVAWALEFPGELVDLAVAADGTIVASGWDDSAFLTAFAPDGSELWTTQAPNAGLLTVDAAGTIFLLAAATGVHAFAPDATPLWTSNPVPPPEAEAFGLVGLAATGDALYTGMRESSLATERLVVRRHDLATGEVAWETRTSPDRRISPGGLAVVGDHVVVVGRSNDDQGLDLRSMLAVFDTAGTLLSLDDDAPAKRHWFAVAPLGDGDLVMTGQGSGDPGLLLRRLGPDHAEVWTTVIDGAPTDAGRHVATGPGERIAVVGSDLNASAVRLYDAAGAPLWTSRFVTELPNTDEIGVGAGFGPDFLAAGGTARTVVGNDVTSAWWLRRFALD